MARLFAFLRLTVLLPCFCFSVDATAGDDFTFRREFFGINVLYAAGAKRFPGTRDTVIPPFFGSWRLWDAIGTEWLFLEPKRGQWNFEYLDCYVDIARPAGLDLLLTLGQTPQWAAARPLEMAGAGMGAASPPADFQDWREYVRTVVQRYRGKIRAYEIWNEPHLAGLDSVVNSKGNAGYFSGNSRELVELARAAYEEIKNSDPDAVVVSPSFVGQWQGIKRLAEYLKNGGCNYADVIGFHLYQVESTRPEDLVELIRAVRKTMADAGCASKPLWNTEFGVIIQPAVKTVAPLEPGGRGVLSVVQPDTQVAARIVRYLLIAASEGVERYYWYALDSGTMGLETIGADGKTRYLNAAGRGYEAAARYLSGKKLKFCEVDAGVWTCTLEHLRERSWVVWNSSEVTESITARPEWVGLPLGSVDGLRSTVPSRLSVSGSPVFIN